MESSKTSKRKVSKNDIIFVNGKRKVACLISKNQIAFPIEEYNAYFVPEEGCDFTATNTNNYSFCLVLNKGRIKSVNVVKDDIEEEGDVETNYSIADIIRKGISFKGRMIILFCCENDLIGFHLVYADTTNYVYRSVRLDVFGYDRDEIIDFFTTIICAQFFKGIAEKRPVDSLVKLLDDTSVREPRNE